VSGQTEVYEELAL